MDKLIGRVFKSNNYGYFKVCRFVGRNLTSHQLYKIKFLETGTFKIVGKKHLRNGAEVKDNFYPKIYGIGFLGNAKVINNRKIYQLWMNILGRCYNKKMSNYSVYGLKGVIVCKRWQCFENFLIDIIKIKGWNKSLFNLSLIELDKDILQQNLTINENRIYSPITCIWISKEENNSFQPRCHRKFIIHFPDGKICIRQNQSKFGKEVGIRPYIINDILNKRRKSHKGWWFEYV